MERPAPSSLPSSPSTPDDSSLSPTLSDDLAVGRLRAERVIDIPAVCDSEQCCVNRDQGHGLKTTVEVLEAEIESLKYELNLCKREEHTNEDTWTKVQTKTSKVPDKSTSKYND
ncbi:hypothetical protein J6590_038366 [Homalodisca vitripennis]|nr:hypothetical protein J6590_038366 [Homalodisca vitripennis]